MLIVDDDAVARTTIRELLRSHEIDLCGEAKDGKEALVFMLFTEIEAEVERRMISGMAFVRDAGLRARALDRAKGFCEYCAKPGFATADGGMFLETQHVVPLGEGGADTEENIAALCPNHHREAHHGARRDEIRRKLLRRLRRFASTQAPTGMK